jgi:hypothetical protein
VATEARDRDRAPDEASGADGESPAERVSRELDELLQQLRIALPGVQVLFAFLLTVPFTNRFDAVDGVARDAFFVAFMATTAATALLLAPVAYARIQFRHADKERLLRLGTVTAILGLVFLAIAITAVAFVVTQVLYANVAAGIIAAVIAVLLAVLWFGVPLAARLAPRMRTPAPGQD